MKNPKSSTTKGSVTETGKVRFHPPVQTTLENHFESSMLTHSNTELEQIIKRYEQNRDYANEELGKILDSILTILRATNDFYDSTTQESVFKKIRDETQNDQELRGIFGRTESAIINADKALQSTKRNAHFQNTFSDSIEYCKKFIIKQVGELKTAHDTIFDLYQNHSLKKLVELNQRLPNI